MNEKSFKQKHSTIQSSLRRRDASRAPGGPARRHVVFDTVTDAVSPLKERHLSRCRHLSTENPIAADLVIGPKIPVGGWKRREEDGGHKKRNEQRFSNNSGCEPPHQGNH